jgi:hypothetical protein
METVGKMNNTMKTLTYLTFKGSITHKENNTQLSKRHPFKDAQYMIEYIKKGTPHVQTVFGEEGSTPTTEIVLHIL